MTHSFLNNSLRVWIPGIGDNLSTNLSTAERKLSDCVALISAGNDENDFLAYVV